MKYPRRDHYLIFKRISADRVELEDCIMEEKWEISVECARFLKALNGHRNPYEIDPDLSEEDVDDLLDFYAKEGWLYSGERIMPLGIGSVICTLFIPDVKRRHRILAKIFNCILIFLCIPLFLGGIWMLVQGEWEMVARDHENWIGFVGGYIVGAVFHELSHACASLSYGGHWFEAGIMLRYFLPGAYIGTTYKNVKNRFKRAQILAAGVECNLAIAGISLLLLKVGIFDSFALIIFALDNMLICVFNLSLIRGFDGMEIYAELLGVENLVEKAKRLLWDRQAKQMLRRRGINGKTTIVCCYIVIAFQILLPLILILNVVSIFCYFIA